jgi:hypothetical protein
MTVKRKSVQRVGAAVRLALTIAGAVVGLAVVAQPVLAQYGFGNNRGGMFDSFFGGGPRYNAPSERPADFTKAPAPRKLDQQPDTTVLVLGDSMSDWLAYGLEDALGDTPDLGVVRKNRAGSGLIRYDARNEAQDWPHMAREAIAATKPKFIVMMVGLNDRQAIREKPLAAGGAAAPGSTTAPPLVPQAGAAQTDNQPGGTPSIIADPQSKKADGLITYEFRTEEWAEFYIKKIDAMIAALKSGGVPVLWVGLPSVRGPKSTSDMLYLNDLYRTRAEKAGVTYIDVWDGFVDENGRFTVQGPDFEGQTRRLRVSDGVHFTKAGSRKLAHYLEREIRRMTNRGNELVALPTNEPQTPAPSTGPGAATARPLSGPVVPLTVSANSSDLLGGNDAPVAPGPRGVTRVLVKGEAVPAPAGRSDDFKWPRRAIAPFGTDPAVASTTDPLPVMQPPKETTVAAPAGNDKTVAAAPTKKPRKQAQSQGRNAQQRAPQGSSQGRGFNFFQ